MWRDVTRWLATFQSAVIVWRDAEGFPSSLRCHPAPHEGRQALAIDFPPGRNPRTGPAGLLCHSHDRDAWSLRSLHVNGELQDVDGMWWFVPRRLIPGLGIDGIRGQRRAVLATARDAREYLRRRGLSAPVVDWTEIDAGKHEGAVLFDAERRARRQA